MAKVWRIVWMVLALAAARPVADVWDANDAEDDAVASDNHVLHGAVQIHDLAFDGAIDQDWYGVSSLPWSSFEFAIDGLTGRLGGGTTANPTLDLMSPDGLTVVKIGVGPPGNAFAYARTLRWVNTTSVGTLDFVRVANPQCGTLCNASDQYTARFWDTTASIARFNNSGSQTTVLMLQNPASYTITGNVFYWSAAGALLASSGFSINARALAVINTLASTGNTGGSITIAHDGRYGDLQGKAVALEPSTGFSFDTPLVYRPH